MKLFSLHPPRRMLHFTFNVTLDIYIYFCNTAQRQRPHDWYQFVLHLRRFLSMPQIFSHEFLNIFRRHFECWYLSVVVNFINLFVCVVQLDPCLSCSCCNFSLARRISTLNRLVMTFLKLGHCMVSAVRSCEFKFRMSTNTNWI